MTFASISAGCVPSRGARKVFQQASRLRGPAMRGFSWARTSPMVSPGEALFYCVLLTLPFEELYTIAGVSITKVAGLLFFVVSITEWRTFYGKVPRALLILLGFIGIGLAVDLATCARMDYSAINYFCRFILVWWLMLAAYNLACNSRFERVVTVMYITSLLFACFQGLSLGRSFVRVEEGAAEGEEGVRLSVLATDPNFAAAYIGLGVLFGLAHGLNLIKTRPGYRILFLVGAAIGFYAMLKAGSRGGFLALVSGMLSLVFTARQTRQRAVSLFAIASVILAMGVAVANHPYLAARFRSSAKTLNTSGRLEIWAQAARLSAASPLYGYGNYMQSAKLGETLGSKQRGTHNLFLSVLLGSGLVGVVFFLCFYVRAFKAIWSCKAQKMGGIVFSWFVLTFVAGWSLNMESLKWFWVVLALSLAAETVYRRSAARAHRERGVYQALGRHRVPAARFSVRQP